MTALKIKNELLRIISDTDDVEMLSLFKEYVTSFKNVGSFELSEKEQKMVKQAREDVKEGRVYTKEEARQKFKSFLESKKAAE